MSPYVSPISPCISQARGLLEGLAVLQWLQRFSQRYPEPEPEFEP